MEKATSILTTAEALLLLLAKQMFFRVVARVLFYQDSSVCRSNAVSVGES